MLCAKRKAKLSRLCDDGMCISVSGKIIELYETSALVEVRGNRLTVDTRLVCPRVGDYVLIHAGCAINLVSERESDEIAALYREIEEVMRDD